jgi:tyrosinase
VNRIAVYHHGHEQRGTQHRCKLEDADYVGGPRACSCECATDPAYGGYALASCPTPAPVYVATTTAAPAPGYVATTTAAPDATTTAAPDATTTAAPDATTTAAPVATTTAAPGGAVCGDGVLDAGETCDDGPGVAVSGDGCSSLCKVEPWYSCQSASQATANPTGPYCKAWRVRRDINTLSTAEMQLYANATTALYEQTQSATTGTSNYHFWVQSHMSSPVGSYAHGQAGFLPWHRKYLLEYEKALRAIVVSGATPYANVMIPYFDWAEWSGDPTRTSDMTSGINSGVFGNSGFGGAGTNALSGTDFAPSGGFDQLSNGQPVSRSSPMTNTWGQIPTTASFIASQIPSVNYNAYRQASETTGHNSVHVNIGGVMGSMASPGDPLFWSHHALIDKHWANWQDCHDYDKVSTAAAATCTGLSSPLKCELNTGNSANDAHYNSATLWDAAMPFPNTAYNRGSGAGIDWGAYDSSATSPTQSAKPATWDHGRKRVREYMKINDLGADSYMYEMDDLDQQLYTLSGGGGGTQTLQCTMDWDAFSVVKADAQTTHSTHFASSPSDVITQAASQSSGSLPFELDLDESTSIITPPAGGRTPEQCVTEEFSAAQGEVTRLEDFDRAGSTEVQESDAREEKFRLNRQELQGAMCDGSAGLDETTYLKQMKDTAFRVCSGIAAIEGQAFTEPAVFPAGMMNAEGVFVPNGMTSSLTVEEKKELPCYGVPPSATIVAETIAMGKCTGACDVAARVEESWCDIESGGKVPSGWSADNFQLKSGGCNTCSCTDGSLECRDVECGASPEIIRSVRQASASDPMQS